MICLWALAASALSSCTAIAPVNSSYHRRLWEKAQVEAHAKANHDDLQGAAQSLEAALVEAKQLGNTDFRQALTQIEMADLYRRQGKDDDALQSLNQARSLLGLQFDGSHPTTGYDDVLSEKLAGTNAELAAIYLKHNQDAQAADCLGEALKIYQALWQIDKSKLLGQLFARALAEQAYLCEKLGQHKQSQEYYKRALATNIWAGGSRNVTSAIENGYQSVLQTMGEANPQAIIDRDLRASGSSVIEGRDNWARAFGKGVECQRRGDFVAAKKNYDFSFDEGSRLRISDAYLLKSLQMLAFVTANTHDYEAEESYLKRMIAILERNRGYNDPTLIEPLWMMIHMYANLKKYDLAEPYCERMDAVLVKHPKASL
jgi:tetratricopeptide (TPR) repeat protein